MTDPNNRSFPATTSKSESKNPFFSLSPSFWLERKLAVASAWVLFAVVIVALTVLNHKQPQAENIVVAAPQESRPQPEPQAPPEPFDITLSSDAEAAESPVVPIKASTASVKPQKAPAEKAAIKPAPDKPTVEKIEPVKAVMKKPETEKAVLEKKEAGKPVNDNKEATLKTTQKKAPVAASKIEAKKKVKEVAGKKPETKPQEGKANGVEGGSKTSNRISEAEQQAELARESMVSGDVKQAMVYQHRAVELNPNNMLYRLNLGVMHDRVADKAGAATLYQQVIDAYENNDKSLPKINVEDVRSRLDYISNE